MDAGYDAVEVHVGHGYLLWQFLSPYNSGRKDEWGGALENRARFPRQVLRAVRDAAGPGAAVYAKFNMDDGFKGGLTLDDGVEVARLLEADGSVDALQLTGGHTTKTPMYLMRGDVPLHEMLANEKSWVRRWGLRLFAPSMLKAYPFEEAFFLPLARRFREAVRLPLMLLGGATLRASLDRPIPAGFKWFAVARPRMADPARARGRGRGPPWHSCRRIVFRKIQKSRRRT